MIWRLALGSSFSMRCKRRCSCVSGFFALPDRLDAEQLIGAHPEGRGHLRQQGGGGLLSTALIVRDHALRGTEFGGELNLRARGHGRARL